VWAECRGFIYKNSVRTSQETHYVSATETNRLMLFSETVAVYCENHTEHTNVFCARSRHDFPRGGRGRGGGGSARKFVYAGRLNVKPFKKVIRVCPRLVGSCIDHRYTFKNIFDF
jgi:hypothetical protein